MNSILTLIATTVLISVVFVCKGQSKSSVYLLDKFSVVEGKLSDGRPIIGSMNMAYKNYTKKVQYQWCLKINIALDLKHVTQNGLPLKSESDIANKLQDDLLKEIRKIAIVHYIGHLYNDSFLDIYAYLDKPEKVNQYLQREVNKPGLVRGFAYEMKQDPNWDAVKSYLK